MQPQEVVQATNVQEFNLDGRASIGEIYQALLTLADGGWQLETIYDQPTIIADQAVTLPTVSLRTPQTGQALWLIGGIHGEEPAGPNAIARQVKILSALGQKFPIVLLPLLNPEGYRRGWRYPDEARDWHKGHSVSDAEHVLPSIEVPTKARRPEPASENCAALTNYVLELARAYPPRLVIDLHEDENPGNSYIYSHGVGGANDAVGRELVTMLQAVGVTIESQGTTRFGEAIIEGVVSNVHDGSIDEMLASQSVIVGGQAVPGPAAPSVIVVETPASRLPLPSRIDIHVGIIAALEKLWGLLPQ